MSDPESIASKVKAAFPAEPRPSKEALFNDHCDECLDVSKAFGARPWPEISLQDLLAGGETALLTAAAPQDVYRALEYWTSTQAG